MIRLTSIIGHKGLEDIMAETFAIPAVGAIIVKKAGDNELILVQNRKRIILSTFLCEAGNLQSTAIKLGKYP